MLRERPVCEVALQYVRELAAEDSGGFAVVNQIAVLSGMKGKRRVAAEARDLIVEVFGQEPLQRNHAVIVLFELGLGQIHRRFRTHARQREGGSLTGITGDLEVGQIESTEETQTRGGVQEVRKIGEAVADSSEVVLRLRAWRRGFQPAAILKVEAGGVITE